MPYPENTPGAEDLLKLPAGEIAKLPVELLAAMQREIDAAARRMKAVTADGAAPSANAPRRRSLTRSRSDFGR